MATSNGDGQATSIGKIVLGLVAVLALVSYIFGPLREAGANGQRIANLEAQVAELKNDVRDLRGKLETNRSWLVANYERLVAGGYDPPPKP